MRNYDNADLGICALLLIAVASLVTGYAEQGMVAVIVAAIAGIARGTDNNKP